MRSAFVVASAVVVSMVACGGAPGDEARDATVQPAPAEAQWTEVERGVWERPRVGGGHERVGFGVEGLEYVLRKTRAERESLLKQAPRSSAARLEANALSLQALEAQLREASAPGGSLPPPVVPPKVSSPPGRAASFGLDFCGGVFEPDVLFNNAPHLLVGEVTAKGRWTEPAPYATNIKTLYTYVYAAALDMGPGYYDEDYSMEGPFSGSCCASIETFGGIAPTGMAYLLGRVTITSTHGCSDQRVYEATSY
ncbi:hypothetical protein HUA74_01935 [Myxococcus sp. CA051A]|uniref:hypothetical protein n=1 Tax=Myxococcus sp. CA051A TaxID=2741739 RepID=UPI00157A259D|nr:hypothetical protein [Myxococcus sp. CA051A]NTX59411.1 hypothetical protein [Myxococcus sp. CA051A]